MGDSPVAANAAPFFAVGRLKFVVLSLTTFNLYHLLWLYQHWRHRRDVLGERVLPAPRSLFPWIFMLPLGYRIAKASVLSNTSGWSSALAAATSWTLLAVGSAFLPDGPPALLGLLPVLPGVWLQALANRVNGAIAPGHPPNERLTTTNKIVVVVVVGAILFLLALIGLFMPTESITVHEQF